MLKVNGNMKVEDIFQGLKEVANPEDAVHMKAYMKDQFEFLGVKTPNYLQLKQKALKPSDLPKIKKLAQTKPWWDTIDFLCRSVGFICLHYPETKKFVLEWSRDEDFWLRRLALEHQLLQKEETDVQLLEQILVNNLNQTEFFINKAIGWALRDYSKTNPDWVRAFIGKHKDKLSKLSIKEGSKYLLDQ